MSKLTKSGRELFDPLAEASGRTESTSGAMDNSKEGTCPKCSMQMGTGLAANVETVWYCTKCRVSSPMSN
jgi:ribosomal protein L37AE/L43A